MALKPQRNLAIKTDRDAQRRADREAAELLWAKVDAHIAEALEEEARQIAQFDLDDSITPRAVP